MLLRLFDFFYPFFHKTIFMVGEIVFNHTALDKGRFCPILLLSVLSPYPKKVLPDINFKLLLTKFPGFYKLKTAHTNGQHVTIFAFAQKGIPMKFNAVYYEPDSLSYTLGAQMKEKYGDIPWIPIHSHNSIKEMQEKPNSEFGKMKRNLIIGIRKTHKYVENHKVSDFLVPYTSSGCTAMCLYCYLVCNYNKCSYLRLFVNREQMLDRLIKKGRESDIPLTFEIGSNSDLVLENTITDNLLYTIPRFAEEGEGSLTFPTKFHMVEPLLGLPHGGKVIFRMSVNPQPIISRIELGTSSLKLRIEAVNQMCEAGYPCGLLIAPVILTEGWKELYTGMLVELQEGLTEKTKKQMFLEIILMTYSYIHRAINSEAFPSAPDLYSQEQMTGRGRGRYCYREDARAEAEAFLRAEVKRILGDVNILYIS